MKNLFDKGCDYDFKYSILFPEPFNASLNGNVEGENPPLAKGPATHDPSASSGESTKRITPLFEEWFHGNLNRKEVSRALDKASRL